MNIVEIENKIIEDLKSIRTPEDLRALQKWAKAAKKQKQVEFTVTSFKRMYYSWYSKVRSGGSGKVIGERLNQVDYTSFVFLGIDIKLPNDVKYEFPESNFTSHKIWVDSRIKYGGTEYFPKEPIKEISGINLREAFTEYLYKNNYYIVEKVSHKRTDYFICNNDSNARKILIGRRLNQFDLCNNQVVKITKEQYISLIPMSVRDWDYFYPSDTTPDQLPF